MTHQDLHDWLDTVFYFWFSLFEIIPSQRGKANLAPFFPWTSREWVGSLELLLRVRFSTYLNLVVGRSQYFSQQAISKSSRRIVEVLVHVGQGDHTHHDCQTQQILIILPSGVDATNSLKSSPYHRRTRKLAQHFHTGHLFDSPTFTRHNTRHSSHWIILFQRK